MAPVAPAGQSMQGEAVGVGVGGTVGVVVGGTVGVGVAVGARVGVGGTVGVAVVVGLQNWDSTISPLRQLYPAGTTV